MFGNAGSRLKGGTRSPSALASGAKGALIASPEGSDDPPSNVHAIEKEKGRCLRSAPMAACKNSLALRRLRLAAERCAYCPQRRELAASWRPCFLVALAQIDDQARVGVFAEEGRILRLSFRITGSSSFWSSVFAASSSCAMAPVTSVRPITASRGFVNTAV